MCFVKILIIGLWRLLRRSNLQEWGQFATIAMALFAFLSYLETAKTNRQAAEINNQTATLQAYQFAALCPRIQVEYFPSSGARKVAQEMPTPRGGVDEIIRDIKLENVGGDVFNFRLDLKTYLEVDLYRYDDSSNVYYRAMVIPVSGFYNHFRETHRRQGVIAEGGVSTFQQKVARQFLLEMKSRPLDIRAVDVIMIDYVDALGCGYRDVYRDGRNYTTKEEYIEEWRGPLSEECFTEDTFDLHDIIERYASRCEEVLIGTPNIEKSE